MSEYERISAALADIAGWGLMAMVLGLGFCATVGSLWIIRGLTTPRHERRFDNLARNTRGRAAMARTTK